MKKDSEEDSSPCPIDSFRIQVLEHGFNSSSTVSPYKDEPEDGGSISTETVFDDDDDDPNEWSLSELNAAVQSTEDTTESWKHPSDIHVSLRNGLHLRTADI